MLNKFKMFAGVALAILAFASCEKEETSMSVYDLPGRAIVKGTVYYSEKQEYVEGEEYYKETRIPKADVTVFAKIKNSDIFDEAEGFTTIETKTDEQGHYELEIPVPEDEITIDLEAQSFEGRKVVVDVEHLEGQDTIGVFKCDVHKVKISSGTIKFQDIVYSFTPKSYTELEIGGELAFSKTRLNVKMYYGNYDSYGKPVFSSEWYWFGKKINIKIVDNNNGININRNIYYSEATIDITHFANTSKTLTITVSDNSDTWDIPKYGEIEGTWMAFNYTYQDYLNQGIDYTWKNGFKSQKITIDPWDKEIDLNLFMLFKPDVDDDVDDEYYKEWLEAYFNWEPENEYK